MRLKSELYKNERNIIISKIINILKLDNDNSITLYELDNDNTKQEEINNLVPDIKKYFCRSAVKSLRYPEQVKRVYLSIIKFIVKEGYKILISDYRIKQDDKDIRTKKYTFIKKII